MGNTCTHPVGKQTHKDIAAYLYNLMKIVQAKRIEENRERDLAFTMVTHLRLGENSAASVLDDDMLCNILCRKAAWETAVRENLEYDELHPRP